MNLISDPTAVTCPQCQGTPTGIGCLHCDSTGTLIPGVPHYADQTLSGAPRTGPDEDTAAPAIEPVTTEVQLTNPSLADTAPVRQLWLRQSAGGWTISPTRDPQQVLTAMAYWTLDPRPSERTPKHLAVTRFTYDEALRLARDVLTPGTTARAIATGNA
jgi:hypothetical protein